jgi:trehalose synthase-fused probable maltokinase
VRGHGAVHLDPSVLRGEQSNTSITYGDRFIFKLFAVPTRIDPDLEVGRFLTQHSPAVKVPAVAGYLEYRRGRAEPMTLGILQEFVPNEGSAWDYTLDAVRDYLERVIAEVAGLDGGEVLVPTESFCGLLEYEVPSLAVDVIGPFLQSAELLGQRTGEMHTALASAPEDPAFAPEAFTPFYRQSIFQSMRTLAARVLPLLQSRISSLPGPTAETPAAVGGSGRLLAHFRGVIDRPIGGMRTRIHGDYHLGQVLYTGKDFAIIDFEGEPARPLGERRLKRSPLHDVAGMLRSFHYAAYAALRRQIELGMVNPERGPVVETWLRFWYVWSGVRFLDSYLRVVTQLPLLPQSREEIDALLGALMLDKAVYEIGYELNNRPEWVHIPIKGALQLLEGSRNRLRCHAGWLALPARPPLRHSDHSLRQPSPDWHRRDAVIGVLRALGADLSTPADAPAALRERQHSLESRVIEPAHVVWDGQPSAVPVNATGGKIECSLRMESGDTREWRPPGGEPVALGALPFGYHRLVVRVAGAEHRCLVISAPSRAFSPPADGRTKAKRWGAFLPLYALHSDGDWGAGDFSGLRRLAAFTGRLGGSFVATLPIMSTFLDEPFNPSPYAPVSRLFWNEFYVNVDCIPELKPVPKPAISWHPLHFSRTSRASLPAPRRLSRRDGDEAPRPVTPCRSSLWTPSGCVQCLPAGPPSTPGLRLLSRRRQPLPCTLDRMARPGAFRPPGRADLDRTA